MMKFESRPIDTRSEISESGTTNTSGNGSTSNARYEELTGLAHSLGLTSKDELYEDHFRIDRKKLEDVILGRSDEVHVPAEDFFHKIKMETHTSVFWPKRLKIGAKAKKDPHVRIYGRKEDVKYAKEKIMAVLDSRGSRITMKIDVSYTDHSHIIGRGGLTIKKVMEETGCHVHFPDSNRSINAEKSNQVSVAGSLLGLERARYRIRELTPLIFCFEYPLMGSIPSANSPFVQIIQDTYNVQVMFRNRPKLQPTLVMVKGCEKDVDRVKEATIKLIEHMCGSLANQTSVIMMLEISPQHHVLMEGPNAMNLKTIMAQTGAQIVFPEANDPIIPVLKKSSVTVSGNINSVYLARQMLVGSLPISIIFETDPDSGRLNTNFLNELMTTLDVHIVVKKKTNQNICSIMVRGYERNGTNIYKAQRAIFGSTDQPVIASIPSTYHIGVEVTSFLSNVAMVNAIMNNNNVINKNNNLPPLMNPQPGEIPMNMTQTLTHLLEAAQSQLNAQQLMQLPLMQNERSFLPVQTSVSPFSDMRDSLYSSINSINCNSLLSPTQSPRNSSPVFHGSDSALDNCDQTSARQFYQQYDYNQMRMQAANAKQGQPSNNQLRVPTNTWAGYGFSDSSPSGALKDFKAREGLSKLYDSCYWGSSGILNSASDYGSIEELGAMGGASSDSAIASSGYGLSSSNYLDGMSSASINNLAGSSNYTDISSLLASMSLEKYDRTFRTHEIDLNAFKTLSEDDLKEIGVGALGARRKLLLAIAELNKDSSPFKWDAAPGAERKSSSRTNINFS
ncbi:hypothetical protein WDU94_005144 [Cyamophila willieti]